MTRYTDWLSSRTFRFVHSNNLVYNTCWEDPRLDRQALNLGADDRIMMITSAGCNALDYALDNPKEICTVDMNPRQNALLELKVAAIRNLDFDTFFQIFGAGRLKEFPELYQDVLRKEIPEAFQKIWDRNLDYFTGGTFRTSFYFRGSSGLLARMIRGYLDVREIRDHVLCLFDSIDVKDQAQIYYDYLKPFFWNKAIQSVMSWDIVLSLAGVPRAQRKQLDQQYKGGISKFIEDQLDAVFAKLPLQDNYFYWLYLMGRYSRNRCPEYLKEENFNKLKGGLVDKISTHTGKISEYLRETEKDFSRYILLDHMDWLSAHGKDELTREWQGIYNTAREDARILWRSGGLRTPFVDKVRIETQTSAKKKSRRLGDILQYNTKLAKDLHKMDRVHTYGSFYIADLQYS